jgi:hypothetical protein
MRSLRESVGVEGEIWKNYNFVEGRYIDIKIKDM